MNNSKYTIDLTLATPAYPSHPSWGFTYNQQQAMHAISSLQEFEKFIEFQRSYTEQMDSDSNEMRPPSKFNLIAIMKNGDYVCWALPCYGVPKLLAVTSDDDVADC